MLVGFLLQETLRAKGWYGRTRYLSRHQWHGCQSRCHQCRDPAVATKDELFARDPFLAFQRIWES